ncbi:MAG: peptidylprolyl isomerase [Spirochaetia bacterium]|nr:peptidylprolyl isomerase [Spirochaetia bacterium]
MPLYKNKKQKIISVLFILLSFCSLSLFAQDNIMMEPAAVVNLNKPKMISKEEVNNTFDEYVASRKQQNAEITNDKSDILDVLIENELLIQGADRAGITVSENEINTVYKQQKDSVSQQLGNEVSDEQFAAILSNYYNKTINDFKNEIRDKLRVEKYIRNEKKDVLNSIEAPAKSEVESFYKENASSFTNPEYIRLKHIYVDTRGGNKEEAYSKLEDARRKLAYGNKSFDELAMEISDDQSTKFNGGDLGWLAINDENNRKVLGSDFYKTVFSLEVDKLSKIIESNAGYHLVKVVDRREPKLLKLYDKVSPDQDTTVYQYISRNLFNRKQAAVYQNALDDLVEKLRKEADIEILMDFE